MHKKTLKAVIIFLFILVAIVFAHLYKTIYGVKGPYVLITVDVERDIPPFLDTYKGVTEGVPLILGILKEQKIKATFFVTGNVAIKYPDVVELIAKEGHEIGGQGFMHEDFSLLGYEEKHSVINRTTQILKKFDVKSFRSPYQSADDEVIDILEEMGYCAEASYEKDQETHVIINDGDGRVREIIKITSDTLFYPSSTYPSSWIDVYNNILRKNGEKKIIVVGLHSWEVLDMPNVEGAEKYVTPSGNYTYTNLIGLIKHLKRQTVQFLTAREACKLFLG